MNRTEGGNPQEAMVCLGWFGQGLRVLRRVLPRLSDLSVSVRMAQMAAASSSSSRSSSSSSSSSRGVVWLLSLVPLPPSAAAAQKSFSADSLHVFTTTGLWSWASPWYFVTQVILTRKSHLGIWAAYSPVFTLRREKLRCSFSQYTPSNTVHVSK